MKAVVILGAGSSADFGVPILRNVFKDTQARAYLEGNEWLYDSLKRIFWDRRGISVDTSEEGLNIEEMLTFLRDWESEKYPTYRLNPAAVQRFRRLLNVLIFNAVWVGKSTRAGHLNQLIAFANQHFEHTTWASFNWDCLFESSFWYSTGEPGAGGGRHNAGLAIEIEGWYWGNPKHTFLKLHGGINWWMVNDSLKYVSFSAAGPLQGMWRRYEEKDDSVGYPAILEPSAYKYSDDVYKILEPQWDVFRSSLMEADLIMSVGYSLPDSDSKARSKITVAFQANDKAKWALVDPSPRVCERYRVILGTRVFTPFEKSLATFNERLDTDLTAILA